MPSSNPSLELPPVAETSARVRDNLLRLTAKETEYHRGAPLPLGATCQRLGINFAVFSKNATAVTLLLFVPGEKTPALEVPLDPRFHRTGEIWHTHIAGLDPAVYYAYRMDMNPNPLPEKHRFNPNWNLLDPYARLTTGAFQWGFQHGKDESFRLSAIATEEFDWERDQPLCLGPGELVIYEMHVRSFTQHPSSGVSAPGTFAGLIEKIPYLKELGISAVELLPVNDFEECDTKHVNPFTGERLVNLWGYQTISFFAPNAAYCSTQADGDQIREFKRMVKAFHEAGIEVYLDVVFNHTAEGDQFGKTYGFRGLDNSIYYMLEPGNSKYSNYSGCGNTLNCNHPVVREMIRDSLRYWVTEMHIDGFRFDLASILGRDQDGSVLENPPVLESLANDPVLANTKLIAEAWDAAGLYQVGSFPALGRWAEWNGRFRDDVRRFVKGDAGMVSALATRLVGSPDLYASSNRPPYHSINFVTCHDGFTLADLVAYNFKYNEANAENNTDGSSDNMSWNCGAEGQTTSPEIRALRKRQMKNFIAILLMSQGVPMILSGDEVGRSQGGNNNAYCQDNETSWFDWRLVEQNADLLRFFKLFITGRRGHPFIGQAYPTAGAHGAYPRIEWHGIHLGQPDWGVNSHSLAMYLSGINDEGREDHIYMAISAYAEPLTFQLPTVAKFRWHRFVDTSLPSPDDIARGSAMEPLADQHYYTVGPRSVVILNGR